MSFPFNVYLAAAVSAFFTTLATMPLWRRWCLRTAAVDDPGQRKIHDQPTPLAGGLGVMTGLVLPTLVACLLLWWQGAGADGGKSLSTPPPSREASGRFELLDATAERLLSHGLAKRGPELAGILLGALGMLLVGWLDDKHELRPSAKFAGQLLIAGLVAASGARITLFVPSLIFSFTITILWVLTVINAFNFMDNMNGLCAGLGAIAAGYFGLLAAGAGQYLVALIAALTFGSLLGFLPHNFPRARVPRRRGQPFGGLPTGGAGDPAALLYGAPPAAVGGVDSALSAGDTAAGSGLGGLFALALRAAVLSGRYQPPFPPTGAAGSEPDEGGADDLAPGNGHRSIGLSRLSLCFFGPRPRN